MNLNSAVNSIMEDVEEGYIEPLILYRDKDGEWHCDYTENQYGETFDWVEDVLEQDPLAVQFTGKDMAKGSYAYVYDKLLSQRLRNEYDIIKETGADADNMAAFVDFFEENIGALSYDVTDYLSKFGKPLTELVSLCPLNMTTKNEEWHYNEALADNAIRLIEGTVKERDWEKDNYTIAGNAVDGYMEMLKISINQSDVILAENPDAERRYMVVENKFTTYYDKSGSNNIYRGFTNDYLEALDVFSKNVQYNVHCVKSMRESSKNLHGVDYTELKRSDCLPDSRNDNYTGQLIIVDANELKPEFRTAEHQLIICSHGNGARPDAIGTSVFGNELLSGEYVCYGRHQIAGIADPAKLPKWAFQKIEKDMAEENRAKKPSILGRLHDAKQEVEKNSAAGKNVRKPKKSGDMEV